MSFRMQVDTRKLHQIIQDNPRKMEDALAKIAESGVSDIKLGIQTSPPTGRTYKKGGVSHVASSEGNPPRSDTGALIGSIRQRRVGKLKRRIHDGVEYGFYLEVVHGRPFIRPVLEEYRQRTFVVILKQEFDI